MIREWYRGPALVLRRTNYGEADRIIDFLTPEGKFSALARGARRDKSKLKGGLEPLAENEIALHFSTKAPGRARSDNQAGDGLAVVTEARMRQFFGAILTNLGRLGVAERLLKQTARLASEVDSPEFYRILREALLGLEQGDGLIQLETWARLQLWAVSGQEIDLYYDVAGRPLVLEARYDFDEERRAFVRRTEGMFSPTEIKLLRCLS